MFTKSWLVIRDDKKKKFEVCGLEVNTNHFTNQVHAMQKVGMNITGQVLPVTNRHSSKEMIKMIGYVQEDGLLERLTKEYHQIIQSSIDDW